MGLVSLRIYKKTLNGAEAKPEGHQYEGDGENDLRDPGRNPKKGNISHLNFVFDKLQRSEGHEATDEEGKQMGDAGDDRFSQ
jgi:hypothetical protein